MPDLICETAFMDTFGFYTQLCLRITNPNRDKSFFISECGLADKNKQALYSIQLNNADVSLTGLTMKPLCSKHVEIDTEMIKRAAVVYAYVKQDDGQITYFKSKNLIPLLDE